MAALQHRKDKWRVIFRFAGKQHAYPIGKVSEAEARRWKNRAEELLMRLDQRLLTLPPGVTITDFIRFDGHPPTKAQIIAEQYTTLRDLRDAYLKTHGNGALESNSLSTVRLHLDHIDKTLGKDFVLSGLTLAKLQQHVDRRQKDVAAITIKKEIDTFRAVWNWGGRMGMNAQPWPGKGLVYPKSDEKLPFMTWDEIERRVKAGGEADKLWDCLYLRPVELIEFLTFAQEWANRDWLYGFLVTAAYTGARRSELIRMRVEDVNLDEGFLTIREKKRAKGVRTTRRVPISARLAAILRDLVKAKEGKIYLFGSGDTPITVADTQKAWYGTFKGKWAVVRGYHTLRHAFVGICASNGIDQRLIDEWVGHQSDQQRRRYRHLAPDMQQAAMRAVFG